MGTTAVTISPRRIALKGQSRSKFCASPIRKGSKSLCARLAGHAGKHRPTTFRSSSPKVVGLLPQDVTPAILEASDAAEQAEDAGTGKSTDVVGEWDVKGFHITVFGDGTVRSVKIVPEAEPKAQAQGRTRGARRGKKFHASSKPSSRLA